MKIKSRTRYKLILAGKGSYTVTHPNGSENFVAPDTKKHTKLYLVGIKSSLHYVGMTEQAMSARLNSGLKATGERGYYGYQWKNKTKSEITLDVICWEGKGDLKKSVEAIEAEIAYLCRKNTGMWPLSQTEIHFRPPTDKHKELAKKIYADFVKS